MSTLLKKKPTNEFLMEGGSALKKAFFPSLSFNLENLGNPLYLAQVHLDTAV